MIIDISIPLTDNMLNWPGDAPVKIYKSLSYENGDEFNVTRLEMGAHTGTHIDAPYHFIKEGKTIDKIDLEAVTGECIIIEINEDMIDVNELEKYEIVEDDKILFKTKNSDSEWYNLKFREDFVTLTPVAAQYLVDKKISTVGIDYLSIGAYVGGEETHRILMGAGIWIIEGIHLKEVAPGNYKLTCLPLKIIGSDGAPARAILEK